MHTFRATIDIIVGNPFVFLPEEVLQSLIAQAGQHKGRIPIRGTINGAAYRQTLMKYAGAWRLYINMNMLKDSPRRVGEEVEVEVAYDPEDRSIAMHPKLAAALEENPAAKAVFEKLSPSRQHEMVRYFSFLKTEATIDRNLVRAIAFLLGEGRFMGRDRP
ncbi:MAG: YdeI/OmpD-associated family protein [Saprospiraceae bacterium]|nr:YdeI/OmpD-associated family protein [Saprospiraceae bacterium]